MAEQYETYSFSAKKHRWQLEAGDDPDEEVAHEFVQANFATEKPQKFERWQLDAISGKAYRESELVQFQGNWYRPEHMADELAEIRKKQG